MCVLCMLCLLPLSLFMLQYECTVLLHKKRSVSSSSLLSHICMYNVYRRRCKFSNFVGLVFRAAFWKQILLHIHAKSPPTNC